jgi:hypothetical protein
MPEIARGYEWAARDQCISQNSRKAKQNGPVAYLTDRKKRKTRPISYHRTVMRKAHRSGANIVHGDDNKWLLKTTRYNIVQRQLTDL